MERNEEKHSLIYSPIKAGIQEYSFECAASKFLSLWTQLIILDEGGKKLSPAVLAISFP